MRKTVLLFLCFLLLLPLAASANEHVLTKKIDQGTCRSLTGEVPLVVIFVDTPEAQWDPIGHVDFSGKIAEAVDTLEKDAAAYGVALSMEPEYFYTQAGKDFTNEVDLLAYTVITLPEIMARIRHTGLDDTPLLLCLPQEGRSRAVAASEEDIEYIVLFSNASSSSIRHELLHLYGAQDLYLHQDIKIAAQTNYADSIMFSREPANSVDSFTAWCIGWMEHPDAVAERFLADTAHITPDMLADSLADAYQTGFTIHHTQDGVYTGMMVDGLFQGMGTFQWNDGSCYTGQWSAGVFSGYGLLTTSDGGCYSGTFVDGKKNGKGMYQWPDGSTYTGDFVNDDRSGEAILIWPDGSCYTGDFVSGNMSGTGHYVQPDGNHYSGGFLNNLYHGDGIFTHADGSTLTGTWENGTLIATYEEAAAE